MASNPNAYHGYELLLEGTSSTAVPTNPFVLFVLFCGNTFLVAYLERELDDSWPGTRSRNTSKRRGHGDVDVWIGEVGPVKGIEELRTYLRAHCFSNRYELYHGKVEILLSWSIKKISRRVTKRIVCIERRIVWSTKIRAAEYRARQDKGRGIEILIQPRFDVACGQEIVGAVGKVRALNDGEIW